MAVESPVLPQESSRQETALDTRRISPTQVRQRVAQPSWRADRLERLGLVGQPGSASQSGQSEQETKLAGIRAPVPRSLALDYDFAAESDRASSEGDLSPASRRIKRVLESLAVPSSYWRAGHGEFEEAYRRIGAWQGPYATRDGRQHELAFWQSAGSLGRNWLISRLRTETSLEVLTGTAELIAKFGRVAVLPIIRELHLSPTTNQAYALLLAFSWSNYEIEPTIEPLIERLIKRFLNHDNSDVREAAAAATKLLSKAVAVRLLQARLTSESDSVVRETLIEELQERKTK